MNDKVMEELLKLVSDYSEDGYDGAYNIRGNGSCMGRESTEHVKIEPKEGGMGLDIYVDPGTKGEKVYIPACISRGGIDDLVYNDFHIGENADILIVAGCGVHTDGEEESRHNGIHRFMLGAGSRVVYEEKHIGTGDGDGSRIIDPVTEVELGPDSYLEMNTSQIGGVDHTMRKTRGTVGPRAKLVIKESILTEGKQYAGTDFAIDLDGEDSGVNLISRSVAKGESYQEYHSKIAGNNRCMGHSECDAILVDKGRVNAEPELLAADLDASLIHEAAIGKVAGEQILKLRTLGLTEEEAEAKIIDGFLHA
ncbi:MAG: SufD family Fe-S cluster assembly protein [Eubacterium sp.]|nr:SufD family Fe-S cluster assembly protein [Eubacterium sp.]